MLRFRPTGLRTRARSGGSRVGEHGRSGFVRRRGRRLCDRDGGHRPEGRPVHRRASQIIVPADSAGISIGRCRPSRPPRARLDDALRGRLRRRARPGAGEHARRARRRLPIAQEAAGPGRIHHVMRSLGPDAARVRAPLPARARAGRGVRLDRQAEKLDGAELDRLNSAVDIQACG